MRARKFPPRPASSWVMERKTPKLALLLVSALCVVIAPAAHAAEPAAPKNAAQWCKAWQAGEQTVRLTQLFPGSTGFAATFASRTGGGLAKKNLYGRCVSLTAKKLAAARQNAVGETPESGLNARCRAELGTASPVYANLGRCIADKGRLLT